MDQHAIVAPVRDEALPVAAHRAEPHLVPSEAVEADGPALARVERAGEVPHPQRAVVRSRGEEAGGGTWARVGARVRVRGRVGVGVEVRVRVGVGLRVRVRVKSGRG